MRGIFGIVYRGASAGAQTPGESRIRKTGELLEHRGSDPRYFDDSFVSEFFGLSRAQIDSLVERADSDLVVRLLDLDVWA